MSKFLNSIAKNAFSSGFSRQSVYSFHNKSFNSEGLQNMFQRILDVHFNLPSHFERELKKDSFLSEQDQKSFSALALGLCGESPWMRQYLDKPSQKINHFIKEDVMKPVSDKILSGREYWDRDLIETTLELERKRRREPLRDLSMCNVLNARESREGLAESHCVGIAKEAHKIMESNLRNLMVKNSFDQSDIDQILKDLPYNKETVATNLSQLTFPDEKLNRIKESLLSKGIKEESIDEIFEVSKGIYDEASYKRSKFQNRVDEMQQLENEHGAERLKAEYAKVRLLFAGEWLARSAAVGGLCDFVEATVLGGELVPEMGNKDLDDVMFGLKKTVFGQLATTLLGFSLNSSTRKKDGTNGSYMVACDTEFHDYPKFLIRSMTTLMTMSMVSEANEIFGKEGSEEFAKTFLKDVSVILGRFLSGSHVAMRTLPGGVIGLCDKLLEYNKDDAEDILSIDNIENQKVPTNIAALCYVADKNTELDNVESPPTSTRSLSSDINKLSDSYEKGVNDRGC